MTAIFDDIHITWDGDKYTIKGDDKILMLLASIEEVMTIKEFFVYAQDQDIPLVKLSMAYTKVLNFVGVDISAPQVYAEVFKNLTSREKTEEVLLTLALMLIPKSEKENPKPLGKRKTPRKKTQGVK